MAISSPAQYCGLRLRRGTRIRELPEEHEVLRRWCEALNQELIGAGGKIRKGVFVAVAEVEPDGVRLDNGMRLKNQELLRAARPSHAVTYASCQGLTLHNRVRLDLESCHLTLRHRTWAPRGPRAPSCWKPRTGSTAPPGAPAGM